jgi:RNA polymerase sigma-70 factor (ECF subfamily)
MAGFIGIRNKTNPSKRPAHFIIIDWTEDKILRIRDFLFAPYAIEAADWVLVG